MRALLNSTYKFYRYNTKNNICLFVTWALKTVALKSISDEFMRNMIIMMF